jgi:hypothetical protein
MEDTLSYNKPLGGGMGYLIVRVTTANGAIPIEGATVTVRDDINSEDGNHGNVYRVLSSNSDGLTERLALPAPQKSNALTPGGGVPYTNYQIDVMADGYYSQYFIHVPIYDTITSIQPAILTPKSGTAAPEDRRPGDETIIEQSNPNLR